MQQIIAGSMESVPLALKWILGVGGAVITSFVSWVLRVLYVRVNGAMSRAEVKEVIECRLVPIEQRSERIEKLVQKLLDLQLKKAAD